MYYAQYGSQRWSGGVDTTRGAFSDVSEINDAKERAIVADSHDAICAS